VGRDVRRLAIELSERRGGVIRSTTTMLALSCSQAGLSIEETASALEISPRTVKRDWTFARAWLLGDLKRSSQ
jgi:hypothetical protein